MSGHAGSLEYLDHPVAQHLLSSGESAQLGYVWTDGTPRTVPIGFHWNGTDLVFGTQPHAPKVAALRAEPTVAVTIEQHVWPYQVLYLRGTVSITLQDDIVPEYALAVERYFGPENAAGWLAQLRGRPMARIALRPSWANVIDFQTRFPSAMSA